MNRYARHRIPRPAPQHRWTYDPRGRDSVTKASIMDDFAKVLSIVNSAGYCRPYEVVSLPMHLAVPQA